MGTEYDGAGDGQCKAIKADGERCTNGNYGSDDLCGVHKRASDVETVDDQLVTDGGQSNVGVPRDEAEELLDQLDDDTLLVYPLGPSKVWAYPRKDYLMLVRDRGSAYSQSSTTHDRVVRHLEDAFWNEIFGTEPRLVDIDDVPENVRRAAR